MRIAAPGLAWMLLAATGCASAAPPRGGADWEGQVCWSGTIGAVGADPLVETVLVGEEETVRVVGRLAENIRLLVGADATLCGVQGGVAPEEGIALDASTVTLDAVDGMPAILGRVRATESGWQILPLDGEQPVTLGEVPVEVQEAGSAVTWVAGGWDGGVFLVRSFAVLARWR